MGQLNKIQIQKIVEELDRRGVNKKKVVEELTDHVACGVELEMDSGTGFKEALLQVMIKFGIGELSSIQLENKKSFNLKRKKRGIFTSAIAASLMFFAVIVRADDRPDILPYQKNLITVDGYFNSNINGFIYEVSGKLNIYATADGKIAGIINSEAYKNNVSVIIRHANGFQTIYTNLKGVTVKVGDEIKKSAKIGEIRPTKQGHKSYFVYKIMNSGSPIPSNKYY